MGQYTIPEFDGDEVRLRVEAPGFETKEVVVSRNRPTTLPDKMPLGYSGGPQKTPGTILIGLAWPSAIKAIMQQMPIVPDLLLVQNNEPWNYYGSGVVQVEHLQGSLKVMAYEVCHAHQ